MLLSEAILIVMMSGPSWIGDRDDSTEDRKDLLRPLAAAIAEVSNESPNPIQSASILIALGQNETKFARYVLEGRCLDGPPGMKCDYSPRTKKPLSRGPFQVRNWCKKAWKAVDGSPESFVEGARCALHYVQKGLSRCLKSKYRAWQGAYSIYRGQSCSDGEKIGSNYKGQAYTSSMILARKNLNLLLKLDSSIIIARGSD